MEWEEPHDSTLYCLQTDGNHLLATGSSYYGVVRLWDRRQRACLHVRFHPPHASRVPGAALGRVYAWGGWETAHNGPCPGALGLRILGSSPPNSQSGPSRHSFLPCRPSR